MKQGILYTLAIVALTLFMGCKAEAPKEGGADKEKPKAEGTEKAGADKEAEGEADKEAGAEADKDEAAETEKPAEPTGPCPVKTELTLNNIDRSPHLEGFTGPIIPEGTYFANVSMGKSASLVFAEYTIEAGQFGMSAPTGDPEAPEGKIILSASLGDAGDALANGPYTDKGTEDEGSVGRLQTITMYRGGNRIVPLGDHTITLTEVTEEHICGEISAVGDTALQSFPYVTGRFKLAVVE